MDFFKLIPGGSDLGATPGSAYFISAGMGINAIVSGSATISPNGVNEVSVFQFVLPFGMTVRKITSTITAGVAGASYNIGIYDQNGNLLIDSGSQSAVANTTTHSATLATPVFLPPGVYFFAQACTSTAVTGVTVSNSAPGQSAVYNLNANRVFRANNSLSGGSLPSTLGGALSVSAFGTMLWAIIEA